MKDNQIQQYDKEGQDTESLSLQDLLDDEKANALSDYLALSITTVGDDAKVSVTTTDAVPTTYSTTFHGITAIDIQTLLSDLHNSAPDT